MNKNILSSTILLRALIITLVCVFSVLPLIYASPIYEQNTLINLKIPCTNNGTFCSISARCNVTIINPQGTIIKNNVAMTRNNSLYNVTLLESETGVKGEYEFTPCCVDGRESNCNSLIFEVTKTGSKLSTAEGIVYVIFLVAMIFTILLTLWGAVMIPFRNPRSENDIVVGVNDLKYLKVFCIVFTYLLLMFIFGITRSIMENFLYVEGAYKVFNFLFWMMLSFTWPGIVVGLVFTVILFLRDKQLKQMLERGVPYR